MKDGTDIDQTVPSHVTFLLVEGFTHVALSCAVEVLRVSNLLAGETVFTWSMMSPDGAPQVSSNGMLTVVEIGLEDLRAGSTLVVVSGIAVQERADRTLLNYLRRQRRHGVQLSAFCSGAYLLAKAGLLEEKACAVHWEYHPLFREMFPDVELTEYAFCARAMPYTASGGTAGAELLLHLIGEDFGRGFATEIADQLVLPLVRREGDVQRLPDHIRFASRNPILLTAVNLMKANIEDPLSTGSIAKEVGVSVRQIERIFQRHVMLSPRRYYKSLQLDYAKSLLSTTNMSVSEVTNASGFNSCAAFSKAFRRRFGVSPSKRQVGAY
ncbi:MAG: GlxA family transcriptional regulator [Pseudomonadota bacterium]